jgi:hypothetical protein
MHNKFYLPTYILVFLVVSCLLDFPPKSLHAIIFVHMHAVWQFGRGYHLESEHLEGQDDGSVILKWISKEETG